jgi:uncharacterized membrane protein
LVHEEKFIYFSSYATSNEVVIFHFPAVVSYTLALPFLVGHSKRTREASPRTFNTVALLRLVAVAVSVASQLTDWSGFLAFI